MTVGIKSSDKATRDISEQADRWLCARGADADTLPKKEHALLFLHLPVAHRSLVSSANQYLRARGAARIAPDEKILSPSLSSQILSSEGGPANDGSRILLVHLRIVATRLSASKRC